MERTDTHRPSMFDPAEYREVGYFDNHPEEGGCWMDEDVADRDSFLGNYWERGRCDHCGAGPLRYGVVFLHEPTGKLVTVGTICAGKLGLSSRSELERRTRLEQAIRKQKVADWEAQDPANAECHVFLNTVASTPYVADDGSHPFRDTFPGIQGSTVAFLDDLSHKLHRWGGLSEKQVAAALKIRDRSRAIRQERVEQAATAKPFREGRRLIEGVVVSTKEQDSDYGMTLKMLVDEGDGNRVWGTVPSAIQYRCLSDEYGDIEWLDKGDRVKFVATVERSHDDDHFGFFKRPTKAEVVWEEESK